MWIQTLTLLEEQGLWIQAIVLHSSCAKAASSTLTLFVICVISSSTFGGASLP